MEIGEDTFTAVRDHLQVRGYTGPINVACDDSKLLSGLRLHYDPREQKHFLVGGIEGPIHVPNPEDIENVMNDPAVKKGTKVSSQCYSQIPVFILFTHGIGSSVDWYNPFTRYATICHCRHPNSGLYVRTSLV